MAVINLFHKFNKKDQRSSSNKLKVCMLILALARSTFTTSAFTTRRIRCVQSFKRQGTGFLKESSHNLRIRKSFATMIQAEDNTESKGFKHELNKAKFISTSPQSMSDAGARIRSGHLVSFPTETVFGLGCHAIDPVAVARVFEAKERPLNDPLIIHVNEAQIALKLWDASSSCHSDSTYDLEKSALEALTDQFWPGPLTIVAKAVPEVPSIIMANTGFVACRSPSHPIARALIGASGVPIAAPSANKFGHVSPTKAVHVMNDLRLEDVWIVDPDLYQNDFVSTGRTNKTYEHVCDVGVESTVAKVEMFSKISGTITILRHGAISLLDILNCLEAAGLSGNFEVKDKMQATGENVSHVAPGQTIRHYSPNVQSFMISHETYTRKAPYCWNQAELKILEHAVVIDFGGKLSSLKDYALEYRDLSSDGNPNVAATNVFDTLRWAENIEGAQRVYFPEIIIDGFENNEEALVLAVKDRLTRAASGNIIHNLE